MAIMNKTLTEGKMKEISGEQLKGVVGGYIFDSSVLSPWPRWDSSPWEVLDEKGKVMKRWALEEYAVNFAEQNGYSTEILNWDQVQKLRNTGSPY